MLFEMLSGDPPFSGGSPRSLLVRRLSEPAPTLRSRGVAVPDEVESAQAKLLALDPDHRFATAAQFARSLQPTGGFGAAGNHNVPTPPDRSIGRSIAVLPFADMSPARDHEYFADGITEEIINALTKIRALRVAARSSAFAFKGKSVDVRRIGEQLGAAAVLEGSIRKAGNRLRVTAQLINATDGYHLWSERYDRDVEDIFAVQDEIATRVAETLRVVLTEDERRAIEITPAADFRAYDYYLRGRELTALHRPESYRQALEMFQRAIEIDPKYARAYAGMADCYAELYHYLDASESNMHRAEEASQRALELDPESPEAHASRGYVLGLAKQFEEAKAEFETAIRLAPTLFESHYLFGRACWAAGRMEEAAGHFEDACRVRPEDYQAPILLASLYDALGDTAKGDDARRRGVAAARRHLQLYPTEVRALYLGAGALRVLGQEKEAQEWAGTALAAGSEDPAVYYNLACFYALGGDNEEALGCLEKSVQYGFAHREWLLNDVDLKRLHNEPRFQAVTQRMGGS